MKTSQFHPIRAHYRAMRIKWGINTYLIWPLLHQRPKIWTKNREIHSLEWYHWNCPLSGQLCLAGYTQSSVPGELIRIQRSYSNVWPLIHWAINVWYNLRLRPLAQASLWKNSEIHPFKNDKISILARH